ncbi:unconventional myosin-X isoform X3 [Alosa sapidissima]|uniref:unconventional myosin-X isoform X3 n=1 Tax=Alosa sapidissima TaxID=34773 RepID=UPI001C09E78B|nr:unconventional myosin-X isoform X3 [Alosa sapidissima]
MDLFLQEGSRVWLKEDGVNQPCTISSVSGGVVIFTTDYGEVYTYKLKTLSRQRVCVMSQESRDGVEDMASLQELHDGAILHTLHLRYTQQLIYTYIGSILVAVNPCVCVSGVYDEAAVELYSAGGRGQLPPHIYALANQTYRALWQRHDNQCVLISGESGSGKTESTKLILRFLSAMSQRSQPTSSHVENAILESSPVLEAFGNARTAHNSNSSRFGKFIQLHFSYRGNILSGQITHYLLEKNRVVRQNPGERNYHIFYTLLAGASTEQREALCLSPPESYQYLNQSGCITDSTINDKLTFQHVLGGLSTLQLSESCIRNVLQVLSAVLLTGNIQFLTAGGAAVSTNTVLGQLANMLCVDSSLLSEVLTQKSMMLRGELISTPLTIEQAEDSRDSLAMALYSRLFDWVLRCLNKRIHGDSSFRSICILDIFGFENFEVNRFEQFNINYANEKLQEYFNKHIFCLEQLEYSKEGLEWENVNWNDNGECLDLIEMRLGLLALLNEESHFPKATDATLLEKLHSQHLRNQFYVKPRMATHQFGVKHYAGEVLYEVSGFLEKNRDTFRDDILNLLKESRSDFVYELFERIPCQNVESLRNSKHGRLTVSLQFKNSLHSLMSTLSTCNPFFVRCIKPNNNKMPGQFDWQLVLQQLRYSGMLETVRIRRRGFPIRLSFQDFYSRYRVLLRGSALLDDMKGWCLQLFHRYNSAESNWRIGKTKVFLRECLEAVLEKQRDSEILKAVTLIQAHVLGYLQRRQFHRLLQSIVVLQKSFRALLCRRRYLRVRWASVVFQKVLKGQRVRRMYKQLLEDQRENWRREEERRREEDKRREEAQRISQVEEILRLEREMELLRRRKEETERSLGAESQERLRRLRDAIDAQASRAAQHFLHVLNFHEIDECVRSIESTLPDTHAHSQIHTQTHAQAAGREEEDVDEGLGADDSPNPSETGQSDGQRTSGIRSGDESEEEEELYANERMPPPTQPHAANHSLPSSGGPAYCPLQSEEGEELIPPDEDSEDEDVAMTTRQSSSHANQWPSQQRVSIATSTSSGAQYYSSEASMEGSDDDFDRCDSDGDSLGRRDSVYSCVTLPYFHSFLYLKGGVLSVWRRRWCVLRDEMLLWFRAKQEALKQGWLRKKGGGSSTLSRRNWKRRWFVLRQNSLLYYTNDKEDQLKGALDLRSAREVYECPDRVNGIDVVMPDRTYHLTAESAEDASHWFSVLSQVHGSTEQEISEMNAEQANPQNAVGSLDVGMIDSVCACDAPDRPFSFVLQFSQRLLECRADSAEEMHHWITLLQRSKGDARVQGQEFLMRGWLYKEWSGGVAKQLRRRWFVLTHASLDEYSSSQSNAPKRSSLLLTSLCTITHTHAPSGDWAVAVYGRRQEYVLVFKLQSEAQRWAAAVQDVIDSKPPVETHTQQLLLNIKENSLNSELVEQIYLRNPLLRYSKHSLRTPLLALPYGPVERRGHRRGSLHSEALKMFDSLLQLEGVANPVSAIQGLLQTAWELRPLREELVCQLLKQTSGDAAPLSNWQIMACVCCNFSPASRSLLTHLKFHLKRWVRARECPEDTEVARLAAFSYEALRRVCGRARECVSSQQELSAILRFQDMNTHIHCHGGGVCKISINSHTTAGEVVQRLLRGLQMEDSRNMFSLFEVRGQAERALDSRTAVADVLAKFERRTAEGAAVQTDCRLYFKLYCHLDTHSVHPTSMEFAFMFEQAHEAVIQGRYPAPVETLQILAALRIQYLLGDYNSQNAWPDLEQLFPVSRLRSRLQACTSLSRSNSAHRKRSSFLEGTLRRSLRGRARAEESQEEAWFEQEVCVLRGNVQEKWARLEGMSQQDSMLKYMNIIREWKGYGCSLFNVQCADGVYPEDLWLAVGQENVGVYKRGEAWPLEVLSYELILSFGAPQPNTLCISTQERHLLFLTEQVVDIARLMKTYISLIVKRRVSTCQSISNQGNHW